MVIVMATTPYLYISTVVISVKTCELEAAYGCVATLMEGVIEESGTFCR